MQRKSAGELVDGREVVQLFRATGDHPAILSPVLATYQRAPAGSVTVSLHRMPATGLRAARHRLRRWRGAASAAVPPLGPMVAEMTWSGAELEDNAGLDLFTASLALMADQLLALRIRTSGATTGHAPTVWLADGESRIPGHVACYVGGEGQGAFGVEARLLHMPLQARDSIPGTILYSPVTQCNLNCIHCISRHTRVRAERLPDRIKAQLKAWCAAGQVAVIGTDYSGDILWADARFGGELDFIFGLDVPFHIDTNGACLTPEVSERLCGTKLHGLNISLDGAEDATFRRIRKGAPPLAEVLANIAALMDARARAGATFPVSLSFALMRSNLDELPAFLRIAADLGIKLVMARHLEAFTADMEPDSLWHDRARFNAARIEALALAESLGIELAAPPAFGSTTRGGRHPCNVPWEGVTMLGNGDVAACCVPGMTMGNLHENTMEEIWNGPAYRRLRETVNTERMPKPCQSCPMFRRTDNPDSYLIHSAMRR